MTRIYMIFMLTVAACGVAPAMEAPALAAKAVNAYKSGSIIQARQLFAKAMQKSVIQANNEWISKTVLSLVELEIQSGYLSKAQFYLNKLPAPESPGIRRAVHWKKAQFQFASGNIDSALHYSAKASSMCKDFKGVCATIRLDAFRFKLESFKNEPLKWKQMRKELLSIRVKLHKKEKDAIHLCEALLYMLEKRYKNASSLWKSTVSYFRQRGMLPQMARSICFLSVSQYLSGEHQLANHSILQALNTYQAIGLEKPGIQAYLLKFIFSQDDSERHQIKKRVALVFKANPGISVQSLLSEFEGYVDLPMPTIEPE